MDQPNKRGRPVFQPTSAHRREVARLRMVGMELLDIAGVLGISEPTLKKYFAEELTEGYRKRRAAIYEALEKNALAGNVSAQKALITLFEKADALSLPAHAAVGPKLGKKEEVNLAALTAHDESDWGTLVH